MNSVCFSFLIYRFLTLLVSLLLFTLISYSQNTLDIKVYDGGTAVPLGERLKVDVNRRRAVLEIAQDKTLEFVLPDGVTLSSNNPGSFLIFDGKKLYAGKANTSGVLTISGPDQTESILVSVVAAKTNPHGQASPTPCPSPSPSPGSLSVMPYRDVALLYGKDVARNFIVVKSNIHNDDPTKRFIINELLLSFDKTASTDSGYLAITQYFKNGGPILEESREDAMGLADAGKYKSKRYVFFTTMDFIGSVATGLVGFRLFGRDAVQGIAFLKGGFRDSLDTAIPKIAEAQRTRFVNAFRDDQIVLDPGRREPIKFFIPAGLLLSNESWKAYKISFRQKTPKQDTTKKLVAYGVAKFLQDSLTLHVKGLLTAASGDEHTLTVRAQ